MSEYRIVDSYEINQATLVASSYCLFSTWPAYRPGYSVAWLLNLAELRKPAPYPTKAKANRTCTHETRLNRTIVKITTKLILWLNGTKLYRRWATSATPSSSNLVPLPIVLQLPYATLIQHCCYHRLHFNAAFGCLLLC